MRGLDIYATLKKPTKAGKQAMWISIRQEGDKPWRKSSRTLTYSQAADLEFERFVRNG